MVGVLTLLAAAVVAAAPAAGTPVPVPAGQFTLTADYHRYDALDAALVATLGTASVDTVLAGGHDRRPITRPPDVAGYAGGFRFDVADNLDCANWPQGITTSRDAGYRGHQAVVVSGYTRPLCLGPQSRSRITLVDWDPRYPDRYQKILLVEPTGTAAEPSFTDVPIHAGGVVWYGDYLYVADTDHGMRVFDMTKILPVDAGGTAGQIGRQRDGTYRAHRYAYVLPQVGTVTAGTTSGTPLVWSSISLDRPDASLVMVEYTCGSGCLAYPDRAPRAVRFPFATGGTTFAATTTASEALRLPWYKLNGVASHHRRWWFASSGTDQLYAWTPAGAHAYPWVGGAESISYWPAAGRDLLWSLRESLGRRDVFAVTASSYG